MHSSRMRNSRSLPYRDPSHPGQTPLNRITDRCKNITFPQLRLRAVNILGQYSLHYSLVNRKQYPCMSWGNATNTRMSNSLAPPPGGVYINQDVFQVPYLQSKYNPVREHQK